jgi:hypothetical protein
MQAIEFETYISNNFIQIPLSYKQLNNIKAKVSIQFENEIQEGNYDKQNLLTAFKKAKIFGTFKEINDSVLWQKEIRNEWE